jgi:hypothetical protein
MATNWADPVKRQKMQEEFKQQGFVVKDLQVLNKWELIGNCCDSFDENGNCINPLLPFLDASEFAYAVEEQDECDYKGIKITYDETDDVHYFYRIVP